MSGIPSFNTAISGLTAAQRALEVISQNVANANTPGYSRQVVSLKTLGASTAASFNSGQNPTVLGGVEVGSIQRIRDNFLESTYVSASATKQALSAQSDTLSGVEGLLNEPGDNGLQNMMAEFYDSWGQLATTPDSAAAGAVVIQKGAAVAAQLKYVAGGTDARWQTGYSDLQNTVGELNQSASDLAKVNQQIAAGSVSGANVNALMDQRDQLVRKIGDLSGATAQERGDHTVDVEVNGITLVAGPNAEKFTISGGQTIAEAAGDPPQINLGGTSIKVPVSSGKAAGLIASLGTDLPSFNAKLNDVATTLRDQVNAVHSQGYTLDGQTGLDFFSGSSALDLTVVPDSGSQIAVAGAAGTVDGSVALAISDLAQPSHAADALGGAQGASSRYEALTSDIGTKVQSLTRAAQVQDTVLGSAEAAVTSSAGVNIDEEMTQLLQYQRAYQASARVINVVDEVMQTLIGMAAH